MEKISDQILELVQAMQELKSANEQNQEAIAELLKGKDKSVDISEGKCNKEKSAKRATFGAASTDSVEADPEVTFRDSLLEPALFPGDDEPLWPLMSSSSHVDGGIGDIQTEDIQAEVKILQDAYTKLRVTPDLKFGGSRSGFKQSQKDTVNVICNIARYAELSLKILLYVHRQSTDPHYKVNRQMHELYLCSYALLRYLQEDHAALMCEADFGSKTKKFYKSLLSNTSSYPARTLQKLELAGRMAAIPTEEPQQPARRGGYSGWSGGPQGGYRNVRHRGRGFGSFGRGFQQNQEQSSAPFTPRHVPYDRQSAQDN